MSDYYDYDRHREYDGASEQAGGIRMDNEFEQIRETAALTKPVTESYTGYSSGYTTEKLVTKKNTSFKKFVAVAVISVLLGAPVLGVAIGAGQVLAEKYLYPQESNVVSTQETLVSGVTGEAPPRIINTSGLGSIVDIVKAAQPSVVNITTSVITPNRSINYFFGFEDGTREQEGSGTGIIFKQDDEYVYIMTNYHVIQEANRAYVSFDDNEKVEASPVGANQAEDVAVIKVSREELALKGIKEIKPAALGDSSAISVGEWVVAIGNAVGNGTSVTYGIISALDKEVAFQDGRSTVNLIQTDAAINQGNSGGALVNMNGEVIGMNSAKLAGYTVEGMGFAIPINSIVEIIDTIMENGVTSRPFIGVGGTTVTDLIAKERGLIVSKGVLIETVYENGGAADAGIRPGDILLEFNGKKLTLIEDLQKAVSECEIGSKVTVKLIRNNEREIETVITISDMAKVSPW